MVGVEHVVVAKRNDGYIGFRLRLVSSHERLLNTHAGPVRQSGNKDRRKLVDWVTAGAMPKLEVKTN